MRRLADAGLTTREACGNSVRNITACPYAGVAADEIFDVTPYAEALTRYLLRHPLSRASRASSRSRSKAAPTTTSPPRSTTSGGAPGFGTRGRRGAGFLVTVAGGTSTLSRAGQVLYEFLPAAEMLVVAEAIVRVFHRLGDYKHKQRNRLKFLVQALGWERFREEFERDLEGARTLEGARLAFDPGHPPTRGAAARRGPSDVPRPMPSSRAWGRRCSVGPGIHPRLAPVLARRAGDFARWRRTNVIRQKQEGYSIALITTVLGDLTATQLRLIGELAVAFGDGAVRVTRIRTWCCGGCARRTSRTFIGVSLLRAWRVRARARSRT